MNKSIKLLAATGLLAASTFAMAQASAPASAAKKELINKILTLQQPVFEMLSAQQVQQSMAPLAQQVRAALQQIPADKREATAKSVEADFKKFFDDATPQIKASAVKLAPSTIGTLLDERFTEAELRETAAWLESPTSKKFGGMQNEMLKSLFDKVMADKGPSLEVPFKSMVANVSKTMTAAAGQPAPATSAAPTKAAPAASKAAAPVKK